MRCAMNEQKTERPEAAEVVKDTSKRDTELLKKLDIMLHLYNDGYKYDEGGYRTRRERGE